MKFLELALFVLVSSCGGAGDNDEPTSAPTCQAAAKDHSGCCSSHGGFESASCKTGQVLYDSDGKLVCKDGTTSPTCSK